MEKGFLRSPVTCIEKEIIKERLFEFASLCKFVILIIRVFNTGKSGNGNKKTTAVVID